MVGEEEEAASESSSDSILAFLKAEELVLARSSDDPILILTFEPTHSNLHASSLIPCACLDVTRLIDAES